MAMGNYDNDAAAAFAKEIQSYGVRVTDRYNPPAVAAPVESPDAVVDEIRKLTDLMDHGHIDRREYDTKKAELLSRL